MTTIALPKTDILQSIIPPHIWRIRRFKFKPSAFAVESDRLRDRVIDEEVQQESLDKWAKNSTAPYIYGVSGNPDDSNAKLFAAYLVHLHIQRLGGASYVHWEVMTNSWDEPRVLRSHTKPTLLVISNLTVDSTNNRIEKTRDLLEQLPDIPRIVVSCGTDPISFFSTRLRMPINLLAYFIDSQMRSKINVI